MRINAAICSEVNGDWLVEEIELAEPGPSEVLVKMAYAGLCYTDEHMRAGEFDPGPEYLEFLGVESLYPIIGGHEGSGVVEAVGEQVAGLAPGDKVAVSFIPACGHCHWCASGRQNLCDMGAYILAGPMISDGQWRHHRPDGTPVNRTSQLGTFAERVLCHQDSLVKIEDGDSLLAAALVSCGISTGFGAVAKRGAAQPGEVVVVVGCGGIGHGAILGALSCGARAIVAVDPVPFKLEKATELGATHTAASMEEALPLVQELTHGRLAEVVALTTDKMLGGLPIEALPLVSKDGRLVCVAIQDGKETDAQLSLAELTLYNKAILGTVFGSVSPRVSISTLLSLHRAGKLPLESLVTREYALDQVQQGYDDLAAGQNIRGVLAFG